MRVLPSITDAPPMLWDPQELAALGVQEEDPNQPYELTFSKYNPTPGTGRTGTTAVPPNNYPFYSEAARYVPVIQPDGGQLSEWQRMYTPSKEQAEADRAAAFEAGVPHGYVPATTEAAALGGAAGGGVMELWVTSELHDTHEYGDVVDASTGAHSGGPFRIKVSPACRVEALRCVIRDAGGIPPALQRLSYAGKRLDDSQRTLEHYGIDYWHSHFPHWPITIRKY